MILASTSSASSLDELAELAHKIMDVASPSVASVTHAPPPHQGTVKIDHLRAEVTRLQGQKVEVMEEISSP